MEQSAGGEASSSGIHDYAASSTGVAAAKNRIMVPLEAAEETSQKTLFHVCWDCGAGRILVFSLQGNRNRGFGKVLSLLAHPAQT